MLYGPVTNFSVMHDGMFFVLVEPVHNKVTLSFKVSFSRTQHPTEREHSGSVVECLTREQGAVGWSLTHLS